MKRLLILFLLSLCLTACVQLGPEPAGEDLKAPTLTLVGAHQSENSLEVVFSAKLSKGITNEDCGFYLSKDEKFTGAEKLKASSKEKDGTFTYHRMMYNEYGSKWYFKAYASNGHNEITSPVSSFTVAPFSDCISVGVPVTISNIDGAVVLDFSISSAEGSLLSECGVCYGTDINCLSIDSDHVTTDTSNGTHTVTITGLSVGQEYFFCSYAREGDNIIYSNPISLLSKSSIPEAVDLGLSVKWASFNVGASSPEEYGGYYQWAGTQDVSSTSIYLDRNNCPYHSGSSYESGWTKYVPSSDSPFWSGSGSPDNETVLEPSDDIAHVKFGGKWRMPTIDEWNELQNNCTWTWTTQNGVNGYKVTGKKSGYTSKSIFLPAAGSRIRDYLNSVGSYGYYWSSSLNKNAPYGAYVPYFSSGKVSTLSNYRDYGQSVRPVYGDRVRVTGVRLDKTSLSLNISDTYTLSATVTPSNAAEKSVSWTSSNTGVATVDQNGKVTAVKAGTATITVRTTDGSYTATCSVTVTVPVPDAVDLGLSVKWASFNIGASSPEEYGGYYQWAGTQDVRSTSIYLDLNNCPYHSGSNSSTGWTKYVPSGYSSYWSGSGSPDNKTVLEPSDDIAHVKLGGKWRMPTIDEWNELQNNCTWTWTTQNGVNGYKVTSKKSGYTSKSIFLPAAGFREVNNLSYVGSYGSYWSSSLATSNADGAYVRFRSDYVHTSDLGRYYGLSVRPVYGDRVGVTGVSLNKTSLSLNIGETFTLSATVTPSNAAEKSVSWTSSNTGVATVDQNGKVTAVKAGTATITVRTTDGSYTATCSITVTSACPEGAVDLGLSVFWGTCNIGASSPEEYGGYYQWAGTQDVTSTSIYLDLNNCPYHSGSNSSTGWTKYIPSDKSSYWSGSGSPDNKPVLEPSDDIAHVKLGGKWRMPTEAEWEELINNCIWTWTTQNGVNGYKVTSKKSGYTNRSIFLPAAGYRIYDNLYLVRSNGYYWSSSLNTGYPDEACELAFGSDRVGTYNYLPRSRGHSVRPVSE